MNSADWNALLLIAFGGLLGFISCALFFPYIPALPSGWGSILGSALGAAGAFIAASWSFSRHQKAAEVSALRPFRERCDIALYMLPRVEPRLQEAASALRQLHEQALQANSVRPLPIHLEVRTVREVKNGTLKISPERKQKIHDDCEALAEQFRKFSCLPLDEAMYALRNVSEALSWISENMEATVSPKKMFKIKHARDCVNWALQNTQQARTGPMNPFMYTSLDRFDEREARLLFIDAPRAAIAKTEEAIAILSSINKVS